MVPHEYPFNGAKIWQFPINHFKLIQYVYFSCQTSLKLLKTANNWCKISPSSREEEDALWQSIEIDKAGPVHAEKHLSNRVEGSHVVIATGVNGKGRYTYDDHKIL